MSKAVIGLGFGDEGKGVVVDHLCSLSPNSLVVRFNGGHQAGHSVYGNLNGILTDKHVFSNFGSGSFRGNHTYWSEHCTVDPVGMMRELKDLRHYGWEPFLFVNYDAPVTTPYDIAENMQRERKNQHGSCGVGFGTTVEREEKHCCLHFIDLYYDSILLPKMDNIRKFYSLDLDVGYFYDAIEEMRKQKNISAMLFPPYFIPKIYEGAQGLLLDQNFGFFPNVTRSNCGTKNIPDPESVEYYLVTRCYQTRHGNGYMSNEESKHIWADPWETNQMHEWQGAFRKGILDMDLINMAIQSDRILRKKSTIKHIVITCVDHVMPSHRIMIDGELYDLGKLSNLKTNIMNNLKTPVESIITACKTPKGIEFST